MNLKKTTINLLVLSIMILIGGEILAQAPNLSLSNVNTQVGGVWVGLKPILTTILGIGGGIFCLVGGIMYFTGGSQERGKQFLLGGIVGIVLFAVLSVL